MNVVFTVRCWQAGVGNGAMYLIPVPSYVSFEPGLESAQVKNSSFHPKKYFSVLRCGSSKKQELRVKLSN